jgi:predicted ATPase
MEYIKRLIHNKIHRKITISSVTVIKGPKYVGKSTVAQQFCNSFYKVPSNKIQLERLARNPNEILIGTRPRFIDE